MRTGRVESVWLERRGTQLTAAAPEGTQVLDIAFTGDFDEDGGQLYHVPTDTVYDYSSFDANAETITLTSPLPAGTSFEDGDAFRVYPLADDAYAHVRLEDVEADEPITARIDHALRGLLPEGQRESGLGEVAKVENVGFEWIVRDVIGAGTVTIHADLESDSYEAGVSGWRLDRNGDSEFNEGDFRGRLTITAANGYKTHVQTGGTYPEVRFETPDGTNSAFINAVDWAGGSTSAALGVNSGEYTSTLPGNPTFYSRLFMFDNWAQLIHLNSAQDPVGAGLSLGQDYGAIEVRDENSQEKARMYITQDTYGLLFGAAGNEGGVWCSPTELKRVRSGAIQDWTNLSLVNGWSPRAGYYAPAYRMNALGEIELRGEMIGGTANNGTLVATLPVGNRPAADVRLPVVVNSGNVYGIVIHTDGTVNLFHSQGNSPTFTTVHLSGMFHLT